MASTTDDESSIDDESTIDYIYPCTGLENSEIFKRSSFACGVYQDRYIVIAGGYHDNEEIQSAAMYDVKNQSYITLPDLPYPCRCHGLVLDGYFYVARQYDSTLYRICLSTRMTWEFVMEVEDLEIADMVTDGKHIFLIDTTSDIARYDPVTSEITHLKRNNRATKRYFLRNLKTSKTIRRLPHYAALVGNKIYIMEGIRHYIMEGIIDNNSTARTFVFDIVTEAWSEGPTCKTQRDDMAVVTIGRWIILSGFCFVGFIDGSKTFVICSEMFDTHTHKWTETSIEVSWLLTCGQSFARIGPHIISLGDIYGDKKTTNIIHIKHVIPDWKYIILEPYIILRKLIDDNRAAPIIVTKKPKHGQGDTKLNADAVVQKLFTNLPLDIFRCVLLFLV